MSDILVRIKSTLSVATISLNRPSRRNAVTRDMWRELRSTFEAFREDPSVRSVVLTGSGGHFCSGADIGEFDISGSRAAHGTAYNRDVVSCIEALIHVPKPTIAAIAGFCVGGGCVLAMACDFRVAHSSARFGIPASRLGILYGLLDSQSLLNLVGLPTAKKILFSGRQFDAEEAKRIGFVDQIVDGSVEQAAIEFVEGMAENAPLSIAGAKLILNALAMGETHGKGHEIQAALDRAMQSQDYEEGVRAFREKRKPLFTGH